MIDDVQIQTASALLVVRIAAALEIILPAGHLLEPEVRTAQDVVKVRCLNIGFQIDLCLARKCSGGSSGKHVHPGEFLLQRIKRITLFDDLIMRAPIDRKPGVNALALFIKCVFLTPLYMQLRRELVQIGVRAGFQLLAQLPDCGAGCGKCVQGRLFLRLRVGQRLLQRICACFQHANFLLGGSLVLAGKHLTKLGDPRGKGMLRLQHADLLVRLVPCVLRSAQRILCFWNLLVQIFFAAEAAACASSYAVFAHFTCSSVGACSDSTAGRGCSTEPQTGQGIPACRLPARMPACASRNARCIRVYA